MTKWRVRVTLAPDGKTPVRIVEHEGVKVGEISYVELIELVAQAVGTLRFELKR